MIVYLCGVTCLSNYNTESLITLHLFLNDLLRRSFDLMRSAYTNRYQTRTILRNRNSNKIVLSGSCVFRAIVLSKAAATFVLVLTVSLVSCLTSSVHFFYVK